VQIVPSSSGRSLSTVVARAIGGLKAPSDRPLKGTMDRSDRSTRPVVVTTLIGFVFMTLVASPGLADPPLTGGSASALPRRVIVHLGTNGTIDPADCDRLIGYAGPKRRVFLVTIKVPRPWEEPNNATLNACADAHDKVDVIRWWSKSHAHSEWFADDGYHLNAEGRAVDVRFVDRQVDGVVAALRAPTAR
jgi:hypothetical protein